MKGDRNTMEGGACVLSYNTHNDYIMTVTHWQCHIANSILLYSMHDMDDIMWTHDHIKQTIINRSTNLKSTVPSEPDGACHVKVMRENGVRALLECATVAAFAAPTSSQSNICWFEFCVVNAPSSILFWPGTWAITRNPRKVFSPLKVTVHREHINLLCE